MEERTVASGILASTLGSIYAFARPLGWLFLLGMVLIVADLRFGLRASRARGEPIRASRAIRRTINKAVDYTCWVLLAGSLGATFGESIGVKILPVLVMIVIYGVETNSCFSNYFEAKGTNIKVDIFKWLERKSDIIDIEKKSDDDEKGT